MTPTNCVPKAARRWNVYRFLTTSEGVPTDWFVVVGEPPNLPDDEMESVEVMPVADHEQAVRELREALDFIAKPRSACFTDCREVARSALARTGGQDGTA